MPTKAEIITSTTIAEDPPVLSRWLTFAMAGATGIAVANIYYNQPMLGIMQAEFPGQLAGLVPTVTQLGYALGIFLLVPLGDLVERKKLIILQFGLLFLALAGVALAPNASVLLLTSLLVGVGATVAQQIIPLAAQRWDWLCPVCYVASFSVVPWPGLSQPIPGGAKCSPWPCQWHSPLVP